MSGHAIDKYSYQDQLFLEIHTTVIRPQFGPTSRERERNTRLNIYPDLLKFQNEM